MIFLQSASEKKFLQGLTKKLGFQVSSLDIDYELGDQVLEFFPELLVCSHFGLHKPSIDVIKKLRENKKIPQIILIKPPHEGIESIPEDQKKLVDEIVKSPIEPLKFIESVAQLLKMDVEKLKQKYTNVYGTVAKLGTSTKAGDANIIYVGDDETKNKSYGDVVSKIVKPNHIDEAKLIQKLKREKLKDKDSGKENLSLDQLKKEFVVKIFKK